MNPRTLVLLLLLLLALLPVAPAITGDQDVYASDLTMLDLPRDRLIQESFANGEGLPRWAPGLWGGVPIIAQQEQGLLYPPNVVLALVAPDRARSLGIALHLLLASIGAWALARELGLGLEASALAGVVYGHSGTLLSLHIVTPYLHSAAWLPIVVLGAARLAERRRWGFALATVGLTGTYLGGDPIGCLFAVAASLVVAPRSAPRLALASVLALGLSAVQLLPALAYAPEGVRRAGSIPFDQATKWSLWPPELLGLVVPFAFGSHADPSSVWIDRVSPAHERAWIEAFYVGPIAFACAVAGVARIRHDRVARAGLALVVLFLPLAFGRYTPLYGLLFELPGVDLVRFPAKLWVPALLGLTLLAASGLERSRIAWGTLVVLLASGALAAIALAPMDSPEARPLGPRATHVALFAAGAVALGSRRRLAQALVLLVALDLALALGPAVLLAPRAPFMSPPVVAEGLARFAAKDGVPARVAAHAGEVVPGRSAVPPSAAEVLSPPALDFLEDRERLEPNSGAGEGVLLQSGFLANPPRRAVALEKRPPVLRGARYAAAQGLLFPIAGAPPWAAVYGRVRCVAGPRAAAEALNGREPVLETNDVSEETPSSITPARLVEFHLHALELEVDPKSSGWLVVREAWSPGWRARVDGVETPVVPADLLFRAIRVRPGSHRVVLRYDCPGLTPGIVVSATSVLVALALLAHVLGARRKSCAPPSSPSSPSPSPESPGPTSST